MQILPTSQIGRTLAALWFALGVALLVFAYVQRGVHDMPVAFTWLLITLTFPIGLPTGACVGLLMSWAYAKLGLPYSPFADLVPSWLVMVFFGYLQWFVLVPAAIRKLFSKR